MGSPSYLDRIAWREGKPQHYSEPKLILDLSHWKHNTGCLPAEPAQPAQPVHGRVEDLGETKQEEQEEEEERDEEDTGDLFQEISRWVESTQSRLHSPGSSPFLEASSPSGYTSSPPLPLSPSDLPTFVFHYTSEYDADRHSPLPPATTSSSTSLPSLFPSSPTSPHPTELPRTSPLLGPAQESQPPSSTSSTVRPAGDAAVQPLPVKPKDRLFDLDVFISRALKLCRQSKDRGDEKRGKEGGWRQESKQQNIS